MDRGGSHWCCRGAAIVSRGDVVVHLAVIALPVVLFVLALVL